MWSDNMQGSQCRHRNCTSWDGATTGIYLHLCPWSLNHPPNRYLTWRSRS
jgi:hypothetical protein